MGSGENGRGKVGTSVAMLMVGLLTGSVMLTPVGAHIKNFNHLKTKHFYTKKAADDRFVNVGEPAANATNAANADKLDTLDSTAFQQKCKDGAFLAYANVQGSSTFSATYTSDPAVVQNAYNCKSATNEVKVRRDAVGIYFVSLPGISTDAANTGKYVVVTGNFGLCLFGCVDGATNWFSTVDGAEGDIIIFSVYDYQPTSDTADNGDTQDSFFSFAVLDYS